MTPNLVVQKTDRRVDALGASLPNHIDELLVGFRTLNQTGCQKSLGGPIQVFGAASPEGIYNSVPEPAKPMRERCNDQEPMRGREGYCYYLFASVASQLEEPI